MDIIEVRNLRLRAIIGFSPHELDAPQDIVVSLRIGLEERRAGETDDPYDAFNYRTIVKAIIHFVESSRFALLEKLAEEIARLALFEFKAPHIEVRIDKPGALRRSDSVGIRILRRPGDFQGNIAYLSLGSNIRPKENIGEAVRLLRHRTTVLCVSPVYSSPPQGFSEQARFLNAAVKIHTWRSPADFKSAVIDRIEADQQRLRDPQNKNAPRTIDLDISLWNDEVLVYGGKPWHIPDADITRFAHVAVPLADIAPNYIHPSEGKSLREVAAAFDKRQLRRINLDLGIGSC